jgi:hypothetical protein
MDAQVFKKMRLKQGMKGEYFNAPEAYIQMTLNQDYIFFGESEKYDFIHLFVTSKQEYHTWIEPFLSHASEQTKIWISYLKSTSKQKYDINRDSFFIFAEEKNLIPNANVALNENWSCVGFKKK